MNRNRCHVCCGTALLLLVMSVAVATRLGKLPLLLTGVAVVVTVVALAVLAERRPIFWLATYFVAILLSPDPHVGFGGVSIAVHGGDMLFLSAVPAFYHKRIGRRSGLSTALVVFLGWAGVTLIMAVAFSGVTVAAESTFRWFRLVESIFPFFFALQHIDDPDRAIEVCGRAFIVCSTVASIYGIAQFFLGFNLSFLGIQYANHLLWTHDGARLRAVGLFNEASGFGTMAALLVWVALYYLFSQMTIPSALRPFVLAAVPVGALALLLSFARAPLVGLVGTAIIAIMFSRASLRKRVALGLGAVTLAAVTLAVLVLVAPEWSRLFLDWRLLPTFTELDSPTRTNLFDLTSGRSQHWQTLLSRFWASGPIYVLVGIGYKSLIFSPLARTGMASPLVGDSQIVTSLIEQGIVGFVLLGVVSTLLLRDLWRAGMNRSTAVGQWAWLLAHYWAAQLLFQMTVTDYLTYFRIVPILFGLAGLIAGSTHDRSQASLSGLDT